jgi:hypothetical protein
VTEREPTHEHTQSDVWHEDFRQAVRGRLLLLKFLWGFILLPIFRAYLEKMFDRQAIIRLRILSFRCCGERPRRRQFAQARRGRFEMGIELSGGVWFVLQE